MLEYFLKKHAGLKACNFIKTDCNIGLKFAKLLRTSFFTKQIRWFLLEISHELSLFNAFENDGWCHFVLLIGSQALISFYFVFLVSFCPFFSYFFVDSTTFWF